MRHEWLWPRRPVAEAAPFGARRNPSHRIYLVPMLIGIAGMVGSGKSTLTRTLAARFGLQHALESVDDENPWLEKFYSGSADAMRTYALQLQLKYAF